VRLPEIQSRLDEIIEELVALRAEISRRPTRKRAAPVSRRITPQLREEIRAFYKKNPKMAFTQIGTIFQVNPGRVSESINGKRQ
jgi:hypothetical protein